MKMSDAIEALKQIEARHAQEVDFHIRDTIATQKEVDRLEAQIDELKKYFISGNHIPIERATILAKDFWRIIDQAAE